MTSRASRPSPEPPRRPKGSRLSRRTDWRCGRCRRCTGGEGGRGLTPIAASGNFFYKQVVYFEVIGELTEIESMAAGPAIRQLAILREQYGGERWSKLKGLAWVRLGNGTIRRAEL